MPFKYKLEILAILAVLGFCALFLYTSSIIGNAKFTGSDNVGSSKIAEMTGKAEEEFHPVIWQWTPPSGEIESALFALQAAIGGIMVGWVFGYWKGQKKKAA
jgi:cobalt/nickel transport protein